MNVYETALERLQQQNIVDVDALRTAESHDVLAEALGPTASCLSADAIARYVEAHDRPAAAQPNAVDDHLLACPACASHVDLYVAISGRGT